ncbi:M1 family metallopeptidase [Niabella hirudinis]|uniref:M1 family metallopeptidase n=1 Tax=Niabella hirudinis TaxID=1285929 RepID=UPI003EBDCC40
MKKIFTLIFTVVVAVGAAQEGYWQQNLKYDMEVTLNDKTQSLTGKQTIQYKNNSPETLDFIWFHLWPNAYKNDSTTLLKQIRSDLSRTEKLGTITYGSIDGLNFKVNGKTAKTEPHSNPEYIDIIKVLLPAPLKPGATATITTDFRVKLPSYFSRSGFADGEYMICQWYPKPAVFDKNGWHEFPYLDMGEFYSEYADYNVKITLPSDYVVGATGVLQDKEELERYKSVGRMNAFARLAPPKLYKPAKAGLKTLTYKAEDVPDFAWFAEKGLVIQYDTIQLKDKTVDAFTFYHNQPVTLWNNSIDYVKDAVRHYSRWIGPYQYPTVQAIEGPKNNSSGGMEYPMITLITCPDASSEYLDGVIAHEVGHNWFMSMLGSNERAHTWQDEGLNTYYQFRYEAEKYHYNSVARESIPEELKKLPVPEFQERIYLALAQIPMQSIIEQPAADFKTSEDYGLVSYIKTAIWMYLLEHQYGQDKIDKAFQDYFNTWKNKHPQPEDMKASFEKSLGTNLDRFFDLLKKPGSLLQ